MPTSPSDGKLLIHTIGTGRRTEEDFIETLLAYDIDCVVDVRSFPKSKIPSFSRENLQPILESNRIDYHWLGPQLGGLRKGGYDAYTLTSEFAGGVDALEALARGRRAVILCAETLPWKCHRRWIARELARRGWRVVHIITKDRLWEPSAGSDRKQETE